MTKLVIFDLDGVLIDSKDYHFDALNTALAKVGEQYVILVKNTLVSTMVYRPDQNWNFLLKIKVYQLNTMIKSGKTNKRRLLEYLIRRSEKTMS